MTSDFNFPIFALSTAVILLTPGPTNTLLAALCVLGVSRLGYFSLSSISGVDSGSIQANRPISGSCGEFKRSLIDEHD